MARSLRIQFPGTIDHVMSRGDGRQKIFRGQRDYRRFLDGLEATVEKFEFEIFSFFSRWSHWGQIYFFVFLGVRGAVSAAGLSAWSVPGESKWMWRRASRQNPAACSPQSRRR